MSFTSFWQGNDYPIDETFINTILLRGWTIRDRITLTGDELVAAVANLPGVIKASW